MRLRAFFHADDVPVDLNVLWSTAHEALQCPKGRIRLALCADCGCITNVAFEPGRVEYNPNHDNSLHFSPFFRSYTRRLAVGLIQRYDLRGKVIVEIGSGKGEFLAMLCRLGDNRGVGFDPTYENGRADPSAGRGITFVNAVYSEHLAGNACDFVCCRQVLEHVPDPHDLLVSIRRSMAASSSSAVFFEVPNAMATFQGEGFWDIIYPHCTYFSAAPLRRLFNSAGFKVLRLRASFGGQYLCLEGSPTQPEGSSPSNDNGELHLLERIIANFASHYTKRVEECRRIMDALRRSGKRFIVWGAGAKGVTFLNCLKDVIRLDYVVDINPHKQGKFVSGTAQQIVAPAFLQQYRPDAIIITNANYRREIAETVGRRGLQPEYILV